MRTSYLARFAVSLLVAVWLVTSPAIHAAETAATTKPATTSVEKLPGVAAAEAVSQVTGIAISPALGIAAVGAWKYYHVPPAQRANLPWWSQPWFWGPALALVLVVFLKDAAGPLLPKAIKKPLDAAELFENKLSALLATGAIIPLVWSIFETVKTANGASIGGSSLAALGLAALDFSPLWSVLAIPLAMIAYAAVFLVSHVIQVLILMSPFAVVDAGLKATRLFLLSTVAATSLADPSLGAVWSGVIILACLPLAGWGLRWLVFGHVFAWDLITLHRHRRLPTVTDNRAFLSRKLGSAPRRSYGRLGRTDNGELVFSYRPWLVMSPRRVPLPAGQHAIGRGLFHPELLRLDPPKGKTAEPAVVEVLDFPPRYGSHEKLLAQTYGITEIREVGLRAVWQWLRNWLPKTAVEPASSTVTARSP